MDKRKMLILINGRVASGKSTIGRLLSKKLKVSFLDTGLYYRSLAKASIDFESESLETLTNKSKLFDIDYLNENQKILEQDEKIALKACEISKDKNIKAIIDERIIAFAEKNNPSIIVGRNVFELFNSNSLKIFLDADQHIRINNRFNQIENKEGNANFDQIKQDIITRDELDEKYFKKIEEMDDIKTFDTAKIIGVDKEGNVWGKNEVILKILKDIVYPAYPFLEENFKEHEDI